MAFGTTHRFALLSNARTVTMAHKAAAVPTLVPFSVVSDPFTSREMHRQHKPAKCGWCNDAGVAADSHLTEDDIFG
jgi:hypothetical protein